jgi:hypothetical protein
MIVGTRSRIRFARFSRVADKPMCVMSRLAAATSVALTLALAGCATMQAPKPWEKDRLARPEMRFDADPADAKLTQHIYGSKESATGGNGVGGGGCGCN